MEAIMNGDAPTVIASVSGGAEAAIPPKMTKQKIARRNELKEKSTMLLSILDENLLKFHEIKDAKTLWEAIKTRFGGNKESKKYLKLLKSLPPAWNIYTLIMRKKSDLDMLSMDDLYNNLKMVNTRTEADLSAAIQNALQTLLPQIREEFRISSGPSDAGGNPLPERLKREYHSIRQTNTETSTEFMQRFLRLAGFLGAAAGTEEEQAKNFQWVLRRSTLNHLMCMSYTDVAQVANAARNYEILHERDDDDTERPTSGGRVVIGSSRPLNRVVTGTTVIITTVMDQTGEVVVITIAATTTTLATTTS
nr:zinc finger, CCHC-type, retrotransposon Gag domain protein [Tanacetum cinerariifolium]